MGNSNYHQQEADSVKDTILVHLCPQYMSVVEFPRIPDICEYASNIRK